ncbi:MAG: acetoacetate decarboxylase [Dehalococcoidia bacterium]
MSAGHELPGRLAKNRFGHSMPVDAPYYQEPPFYYRDVHAMTIVYETDAEAAADLLPEGLSLPLPAQAALVIVKYPTSTFGPYNEAILTIRCALDGVPHSYVAHIVVDTVPPLVGGREIWGFPKKIASIALDEDDELLVGAVERPAGVRLATATMRPERPLDIPGDAAGGGSLSLKIIPSAEAGKPPSVAELIRVPSTDRVVHESWAGPASLSFDAASDFDPWHRLPPRRVMTGVWSRYDFTLPAGEVVRRY